MKGCAKVQDTAYWLSQVQIHASHISKLPQRPSETAASQWSGSPQRHIYSIQTDFSNEIEMITSL
jgi:hypothetical protein